MINDTQIKSSSGRLWGILQRRNFVGGNNVIAEAYATVESFPQEVDEPYLRPLSKSHNPKHARIALILMNEAKEEHASTIAAGILATLQTQTLQDLKISKPIQELALLSHLPPPTLLSMYPPSILQSNPLPTSPGEVALSVSDRESKKPGLIRACLALDEGRHLHLLPKDLIFAATGSFLEMSTYYLLLAQNASPRIHTLLETVITRLQQTIENERKYY